MAYDDNIRALLSAASIVRDETHEGGNTAARVGQLLVDMITSFDSAYKALSDSIPESVDLSILKSYLSKKEAETLFDTQSVFNRLFVEDTTNNAIKALKHLYSVSDISAFGYVKTELPSASVVIEQLLTSGTEIARINGTTIYAPDLSDYYTRTEVDNLIPSLTGFATEKWVTEQGYLKSVSWEKVQNKPTTLEDYGIKNEINTLLADYAKTSDIPTDYVDNTTFVEFKGNYDNLAAAVSTAKDYTDAQISALNIRQYAKTSDIQQWVNDKNYATNSALTQAINEANTTAQGYASSALTEAKNYADGKFNYASITEALYLTSKNSNDVSEFYPAFITMRGSQYAYIDFYTVDDYTTATDYPVRLITSHLEPGVLQLTSGRYGVGTLKIGNAYLTYDSDNNALFVKGANGSAINLVATGDVAAFSGLGSNFDTLTDLTLTNSLTVGGATLTCLTYTRGQTFHALNVANHPLFIGTPEKELDIYQYRGYGLVAYKSSLFKGTVTFEGNTTFKNLTIGTLDINDNLRINPNQTSAGLWVGDMSAEITEITTDGTNVYITINGKQYKLANA